MYFVKYSSGQSANYINYLATYICYLYNDYTLLATNLHCYSLSKLGVFETLEQLKSWCGS